jgi:tetratricopeptide (TPR) repeat protein
VGATQSSAPYPFNDPKYQDLVKEVQGENAKSSGMFETESAGSKLTAKLKQATAAVGDALAIKPEVTPAYDPVSLASKPKQVTPSLYYQAARLNEQNGQSENAIAQYQRALAVDEHHLPSLLGLARLYDRNGNFDLAVQWYRKTIEVAPDNAMAHNDLALCLARHDRTDEALQELRKAIALEPKHKLYRNNLATILVDSGQTEAALAELAAVHPPATASYNVAFLLARTGRDAEARPYLYRAVQLDPSMKVADELLQTIDARTNAPAMTARRVENTVVDRQPVVAQPVGGARPSVAPVPTSEIRRTPPTGPGSEQPAVAPPVTGLLDSQGSFDQPAAQFPASPLSGSSQQMQYPIRKMSGYCVDDPAEPLPVPADLDKLAPVQQEPALEPAADRPKRVQRSVSG